MARTRTRRNIPGNRSEGFQPTRNVSGSFELRVKPLVLFPAVCWHVVSTSSHSCPLSAGGVLAATVIAVAFHTIDLAATAFFLHRKAPR